MYQEKDKGELLGLFYKLRALSDAHLACLSAWRDVEQYCADHKASLVQVDHLDEWFDVTTRIMQNLKWIVSTAVGPEGSSPEYWQNWHRGVTRAMADHIADTLDILDGVPRF